jgi:hypothetical protein
MQPRSDPERANTWARDDQEERACGCSARIEEFETGDGLHAVNSLMADGTVRQSRWSGDRRVSEGAIIGEDEDGEWKYWNLHGTLTGISTYEKGWTEGESRSWYETGQLQSVRHFKRSQLEGLCCEWNMAGVIDQTRSGYYHDGAKQRDCDTGDCSREKFGK